MSIPICRLDLQKTPSAIRVGTVAGTARTVLCTTAPDTFLNQAKKRVFSPT